MKALIQVVEGAKVVIDRKDESSIGRGLLVFLGVGQGDGRTDAEELAKEIVNLRIFPDDSGKMNLSASDVGGELLVVSQFTLYGELNSGRRPSFDKAGGYDQSKKLYELFLEELESNTELRVESGKFGERMKVELTNDGPITLMVES